MDVKNPRRILLLGPPDCGLLDLLKDLTGSAPTPTASSLAGLSHSLAIKTPYYTATVPIWLDEIPPASPSSWSTDFMGPEAQEVLQAIGAFIVVFQKPVAATDFEQIQGMLKEVAKVVKEGCGYNWDGVCIALSMKQDIVPNLEVESEKWEDLCQDLGFEWIDVESIGKNEFNEPMGIERLKEALETNDWAGDDDHDGDHEDLLDDEDEVGFGVEAAQLQMEMFGMKQAIYGSEEDNENGNLEDGKAEEESVEQLEAMMLRMQAMRDMGAGLPEAERKRFAAKAVHDIMKTL